MNATRQQITELIGHGLSNAAIARQLHVDRGRVRGIRRTLEVPNPPKQPLTLEQKWAARTRPIEGGHLEWIGEHQKTSGTPILSYCGAQYTAAAVAFRIRTGHAPTGYALPDCGMHHCVAPDHILDEPGRQRSREQLRYLTGGQQRPEECGHGHDQAKHGKYTATGVSYCGQCQDQRRRTGAAS